jgi:hypothetical protein
MAPDYRSEKSETIEGSGLARRAWDAYAKRVNAVGMPILMPAIRRIAATQTVDLWGFWLLWHLYGGFEGLERLGMHRSTIFRKINRFRSVMKVHPDEFQMPGVTIDPEAYWNFYGVKKRAR